MRKKKLGSTDLMVSELCLGSMTWGTQNTEAEGHGQIDVALDRGINFVDTAEMYPVNPVSAETIGRTESIIGTWFDKTGRRDDMILATKISGAGMKHCRGGAPISPETMTQAVEGSLARLQTDYIDLYQFHWPNRGSYMFRQNWSYDPSSQNKAETLDSMAACLNTLQKLVDQGKIRHFGLSNESAWGTAQWLRLSEQHGLPRVQSIQNEYSLLCRLFDTDLSELCVNEEIGLLAFSPLAAGLLSGKYAGDVIPEGSRRALNGNLGGRITPRVWESVSAYLALAQEHGLDPCQMALAWCRTRPFMCSAIFGATTQEQLEIALGSDDLELSEELVMALDAVHKAHPMPY
ncbi:MAG: aldo/keto reductase [Litoreibacter sp.]|nr:aldo/keto reductase [Litoreibacter sp.]